MTINCLKRLSRRCGVALTLSLALLLVAMATAPAKAEVFREWNNPAGGPYDLAFNWLTGDVADTTNESALFYIAGTYGVTLTSGATTLVGRLFVWDGDVTFNASGPTSAIFETDTEAGFSQNVTFTQGPGLGDVILNVGDQLTISGGSTFNVLQGSDVTANRINVSSGGSPGTMIVDGTGSTLAVSSLARIGFAGVTGTLTLQNGSTGNSLSGLVELMSNSTQAGSTGRLNVLSGSTLQTDNISVGLTPSASAVQEATLTVDGTGSTLTMTGASTLTVGDETNPNIVSDVIVSNAGVMSTGTGAILIQNSGHLDIQAGTFNANGNVTIDGATVTRGSGSSVFNLGTGLTLTAQNAGQINFTGSHSIDQGAMFNIQSGADFDTTGLLNIGNTGGDGTLIVDGTGSSVTAGSGSFWGDDGNTANITFRNGSTGTLGQTHLAVGTTAGTTANLNVESGAVVTVGNLDIAASGGATTSGTITVDGVGSSLTQNSGFALTVGHASSGTATINVQNGGEFTTAAGTKTVNPTGTINIGVIGDGTFNATSDLTVDGGTITRGSGSTGFNLTPGNTLTAKNDAQINFDGEYSLDQSTTFDIQSGADFSTTGALDIGYGSDGTLLVDGAGSSVTTGSSAAFWGQSGNTADVTFRNGATGDLGGVLLAFSQPSGSTGIFRVESGATVTTWAIQVAGGNGANTSGTLTVDGAGSSLTQNGNVAIHIGNGAALGTATVNVQNGGTLTTATDLTEVGTYGTLNVSTAGTFNAMEDIDLAGTINLLSDGTLNVIGDMTIAGGTINLGGGTLSLADGAPLVNSTGTFSFTSGTLELRSTVTLSQSVLDTALGGSSIGVGRELRTLGSATLPAGVSLDVAGGTLNTTGLVMLPGSSLEVLTPSTVSTGTLLATSATTIDATGSDITLGDALAVNGFASAGTTNIGNSTVTLLDANDAVLDSLALVTLGDGLGGAGTLVAANGITLDFGGNATGFGTVNTPNDPFKPFINNGNIVGNSGAEPITLTGYVKGVGTLDNVVITGTDAPGFSPATVYRGSITYAGTLEIELGGTSPGSFDKLIHSGLATLGGILDISLINGFVPGAGDSFDILDWGSIAGNFSSFNLPTLTGNLDWDTSNLLIDGTLSVFSTSIAGDLDADGFVGITDLNIVLSNWNQNVPPANPAADPSGDNFIGIEDLNIVLGNWNAGTPPGETANIPEPATLVVFGCAGPLILARKRRALSRAFRV
jgi:T5SS/PEP-CTERM-associated repeat protein